MLMLKNPISSGRVKIPYQQLLIFLSFMNTFLKAIKQPFHRGADLINVIILISSQHHLQTSFDV